MSSFTGARSHASTVRASHSSRIAAGNASRLAAAGLAIFLTIGFAGTAHADQPADVAAEVVGASAGASTGVADVAAGNGASNGGSSNGGSSSNGAVGGGAAPGPGHDVVVICHNGNRLEIDDNGLAGHEEHDGDPLDDGLSGDLADGSADECVKDHPIKVDDELGEIVEGDTEGDKSDGAAAGKGGSDQANAKKNKKAKQPKNRNGKAKGGNGKAKGKGNGEAKGGNGKSKGGKGKDGNKGGKADAGKGKPKDDHGGTGPDDGTAGGRDSATGGEHGDGAVDAGDGTLPVGNSDASTGNESDDPAGKDAPGAGSGGAGSGGAGAGVSGPGTTPTMPPKSGTATPEVLGEEAGRPKPVAPAKTGPGDVKTDSKNRAPIVIGPQQRADRPRNQVLAAASRRGTTRAGAVVLPQTGLGDDLGMLTGIGGAMVLLGGMTLTAGRRRTSSQI